MHGSASRRCVCHAAGRSGFGALPPTDGDTSCDGRTAMALGWSRPGGARQGGRLRTHMISFCDLVTSLQFACFGIQPCLSAGFRLFDAGDGVLQIGRLRRCGGDRRMRTFGGTFGFGLNGGGDFRLMGAGVSLRFLRGAQSIQLFLMRVEVFLVRGQFRFLSIQFLRRTFCEGGKSRHDRQPLNGLAWLRRSGDQCCARIERHALGQRKERAQSRCILRHFRPNLRLMLRQGVDIRL